MLRYIMLFIYVMELHASTTPYKANYQNANWNVIKTPLECHLEHYIPEYGNVRFYQLAGYQEQSELQVMYNRAPKWGHASIWFAAPEWDNQGIDNNGWKFDFANNKAVEFNHSKTRRILNSLVKGKIPTIAHDSSVDAGVLEAKISSVNFVPAYQSYMDCLRNLVPVKFTDISRSNIYFTTASSKIDSKSQQWLNYIAKYATELNVRRIDIGGYTDSIGTFRANHRLSTARVRNVKSYLIAQGVPKNKILARVFGEHRPVSDNRTPLGRAQNRRVTIRILP